MRIESTQQAFQNTMRDMGQASSKIQTGFNQMLDKENPPTQDESTQFTTAFVEEDYLSKVAEAQLKVLETQEEILDTVMDIYA